MQEVTSDERGWELGNWHLWVRELELMLPFSSLRMWRPHATSESFSTPCSKKQLIEDGRSSKISLALLMFIIVYHNVGNEMCKLLISFFFF